MADRVRALPGADRGGCGDDMKAGLVVVELPVGLARPFIERWHYSHRVPTGQNRFFATHLKADATTEASTMDMFGEVLYAVADYGIGVNPYQSAFISEVSGRPLEPAGLVELKRLCRVEPRRDDLPLTRFIAGCHRILRRDGVRCVVAFSDPDEGHDGGIYKAASFDHLGVTNPEMHLVDAAGQVRHRRFAYRHARRNGIHVSKSREILGLERVKTAPKDRWVKWL